LDDVNLEIPFIFYRQVMVSVEKQLTNKEEIH